MKISIDCIECCFVYCMNESLDSFVWDFNKVFDKGFVGLFDVWLELLMNVWLGLNDIWLRLLVNVWLRLLNNI